MFRHVFHRRDAAFSLIEVLIAIMVLGIGLLMIAAIFPVAGNWTRQSAEESVAQSVARSALSLIQQRYSQGGPGNNALANASDSALATAVPLPGLTDSTAVTQKERAYQFGNADPFPAQDPKLCSYFWTALVHKPPAEKGEGRSLDLYILVFHKGAVEQTYTVSDNELSGARTAGDLYVPTLVAVPLTQPGGGGGIPPGEYAVGQQSGTVYRRIVGANGQQAFLPPLDPNQTTDTALIVAPAADGTAASPLVYVYQTTLSF